MRTFIVGHCLWEDNTVGLTLHHAATLLDLLKDEGCPACVVGDGENPTEEEALDLFVGDNPNEEFTTTIKELVGGELVTPPEVKAARRRLKS